MKRLIISLFLVISSAAFAAEGWQTNYPAALAQAEKENKKVLLDFTGSDWCGWCVKLDKETFSQPEFKTFAAENLVLVEIDFPHAGTQTAAEKAQNAELKTKFSVRGFPTLVLLDGKGNVLAAKVGYLPGGPAGFIEWAKNPTK